MPNKISILTFCKYLDLLEYSVNNISNDIGITKRRGILLQVAKNSIVQNINGELASPSSNRTP